MRDYTFTGLELHDGCYYDITLQSCNGARLCSKSQILNILVDGSPPTPGKASTICALVEFSIHIDNISMRFSILMGHILCCFYVPKGCLNLSKQSRL